MASSSEVQPQGTEHAQKVAKHYNEIQEVGLEERTKSRIFYLRNFNNWVKSLLLGDFLSKVRQQTRSNASLCVFDMCSGKGGDLLKWKKGNIGHLVCADIAGTSVEQSQERYKDMVERSKTERFAQQMFTAEFITTDLTRENVRAHLESSSTSFDLTSCQFSFHYCFESLAQAEVMVKNACDLLRPGGYFIGSIPDSNELVKRLRASDSMSFGNDVYQVSFLTKDKTDLPVFGAQYDFNLEGVVSCPEFLVHFPVFEKLAAKYGMKLVYKKTFAEFHQEKIEQEGRALIGKMQALEPYPPEKEVELLGDASTDYKHAEQYYTDLCQRTQQGRNPQKIGTMSQAEWEATTIYLVFAFQKDTPSGSQVDLPSSRSSPLKRSADTSSDSVNTKSART